MHRMPIYEDLTLTTPDKIKIKAYLMLQGAAQGKQAMEREAKTRPTILFLHANAGNMASLKIILCCLQLIQIQTGPSFTFRSHFLSAAKVQCIHALISGV